MLFAGAETFQVLDVVGVRGSFVPQLLDSDPALCPIGGPGLCEAGPSGYSAAALVALSYSGRVEAQPLCPNNAYRQPRDAEGYDFDRPVDQATWVTVRIRRRTKSQNRVVDGFVCDACIGRHSEASTACSRALRLRPLSAQSGLVDVVRRRRAAGWKLVRMDTDRAVLCKRPEVI